MNEDESPFRFSIPPTSMPPSLQAQQDAFADVAVQLIIHFDIAVTGTSDMTRAAYVLAHCDRVCSIYSIVGYTLLSDFQRELRTDLRSALRRARRVYAACLIN
jgi:hypothetical protein